jgi:large subunit ribosomal protein L24
MERLQRGDLVQVMRGNSRGRQGRIKAVLAERDAVTVEGVNFVKRHTKATAQRAGGIVEREAPIAASNVMPVDPQTGKPTRVHFEIRDGKKVRLAKSGAVITPLR